MKLLTEQQKEKYISEGGSRCPYCTSPNISASAFEADTATACKMLFAMIVKPSGRILGN